MLATILGIEVHNSVFHKRKLVFNKFLFRFKSMSNIEIVNKLPIQYPRFHYRIILFRGIFYFSRLRKKAIKAVILNAARQSLKIKHDIWTGVCFGGKRLNDRPDPKDSDPKDSDKSVLGGWRIKYGYQDKNPGKPGIEAKTRKLEGEEDRGIVFDIPIKQTTQPELTGSLRIEARSLVGV